MYWYHSKVIDWEFRTQKRRPIKIGLLEYKNVIFDVNNDDILHHVHTKGNEGKDMGSMGEDNDDSDDSNEDSKDNVDSMVLVYDMDNMVVVRLLYLIGYQQYIDLRDVKKVVPWEYLLSLLPYVKTVKSG